MRRSRRTRNRNYRHERFTLRAFLVGSSFHATSHVLSTINGLGTALSALGENQVVSRGSG